MQERIDFRSTNKGFFTGQEGKKNETQQRDKDRMLGFNLKELRDEAAELGMNVWDYIDRIEVKL